LSGFSNGINIVLQVLSSAPELNSAMSIYSNPSQDKVLLKMLKGQKYLSAEVTDVTGNLILKTSNEEFDVSVFKAGMYFVKIKTDLGEATEKFIKN
jgi:hypothetical protein